MILPRFHTVECRVGVIGTYYTGKTVLLTSLINHLQDHDPDRFRFGRPGTIIRKFRALSPDPGWSRFDYERHRDALVHAGTWPRKTTDRSQYVCRFERSDWNVSDCVLKLYDLPGERVADVAMLAHDFSGWSEYMIRYFKNDKDYRECTAPFLAALERSDVTAAELLHSYRLALANLILNFKPLVSPSTFLLDTTGSLARDQVADGPVAGHQPHNPHDRPKLAPPQAPARKEVAEKLAASRRSGLSAAGEFCPLSAFLRDRDRGLYETFRDRYKRYVEEVVRPTILTFKSCTALVILVDVTTILAGGVGMYDDTREIMRALFEVLRPGEHPIFGPLLHGLSNLLPHQWRPGWVRRVAFVAPKLDLIHPNDRDRMLHLLRQIFRRLATDQDGLRTEFFNVAAVVSTRSLPTSDNSRRFLVGSLIEHRSQATGTEPEVPSESGQRPELRFAVSPLPDDWPQSWKPGQYAFPRVYPRMPARKDCPPEQINLDRLATFVIE